MTAPADFGFVQAAWDGRDFAAVQRLPLQREHGRPYAEVDAGWHLYLGGIPVRPGAVITADPVTGLCTVMNGYADRPARRWP